MTNTDLAQFLENEACYAANDRRFEDAVNLREAARRLRESEDRRQERETNQTQGAVA